MRESLSYSLALTVSAQDIEQLTLDVSRAWHAEPRFDNESDCIWIETTRDDVRATVHYPVPATTAGDTTVYMHIGGTHDDPLGMPLAVMDAPLLWQRMRELACEMIRQLPQYRIPAPAVVELSAELVIPEPAVDDVIESQRYSAERVL